LRKKGYFVLPKWREWIAGELQEFCSAPALFRQNKSTGTARAGSGKAIPTAIGDDSSTSAQTELLNLRENFA
jgi:hypothetical protein